jgi:transcriptional regulator with XRE-family HTH domain
MARTKPIRSVVEVLRNRLGLLQGEFAERVGLSRRTIQEVEYGAPLTWKSAKAISDALNVSEEWLMANDLNAPMVDAIHGKPWSPKGMGKVQRAKVTDDPELTVIIEQMISTHAIQPLLRDYILRRKFFIAAAISETWVMARWQKIQDKAWKEFKEEIGVSEELDKSSETRKPLSRADLERVKDDVELVIREMPPLPGEETAKSREQLRRVGPMLKTTGLV